MRFFKSGGGVLLADKPKKDAGKSLRLNMIINYLNKKTPYGGVTVREMAEKYGVTERQVHRDLNAIQNDLGVALVKKEQPVEGRKSVFYRLAAGYLPSIDPDKATAIFLSLIQQQGSALTGHLDEFKDALISTLFRYHYNPRELAVDKLQNRVHLVEETLAEPERVGKLFAKLVGALKNCHRVKLWYYAAYSGEVTRRVVEPYGLICKRKNWYLVAHCLERQNIRVFRVDQIEDVHPRFGEKFAYPPDFNLREYMASSWGVINDGKEYRVKLKFSKPVAYRAAKMVYHPSQAVEEELPDGSIIISFKVCGITEMKTWIVQWGDMVEVLEPDWLREGMRKMAERIFNIYHRRPGDGH